MIMNNNIPNNFDNGMSNTNNFNNDPMIAQANEQLVGGQSSVGNGPDLMQGMQNTQNNGNIMQGFSNVQNPNGVMQGTVEEIPNNNTMVMPGQVNSGINNYTMSVETPQQEANEINVPQEPINEMPQVDNAPSFNETPTIQDNQMNIPNFNNPIMQPEMNMNQNVNDNFREEAPVNPIDMGTINNPIPTPEVNTNMDTPNVPNVEIPNVDTNQNINVDIPSVNIENNIDSMTPNIPDVSIPQMDVNANIPNMGEEVVNKPEEATQTFSNPFAMNNESLQQNLNGQMNNQFDNVMPYQNIPQEPINEMPQMNNTMGIDRNINNNQTINNNAPIIDPMISPVMDMPNNNEISNTQDLNTIAEQPIDNSNNIGLMNNEPEMPQMNNNYEDVSEAKPAKKFPLSLRETILVTIALIGIVIVIIMYWQ